MEKHMQSRTPSASNNKRPHEEPSLQRAMKKPFEVVKAGNDAEPKLYKFRVLLPNGTTLELKLKPLRNEMPIEEFIDAVMKKYLTFLKQRSSQEPRRRINWDYPDLHFTDAHTRKIRLKVNFYDFVPDKWHILKLHDGSAEPDAYEEMWDLTPDTELLKELPLDYTFETALADLIDNSLQALWSIHSRVRKLISLKWRPDKITIFDSGPGMDGTDGNLVKWGKMGASLHRSVRSKAIGGEPPYLKPFFGMFGHGGPVATMCLGSRAVVSSKTQNGKKVFTLHLEREALLSNSSSKNCWKTKGGMRDPSPYEMENSPHGSFTKVEIFDPREKAVNIEHLRCKLKDIYFPYIQCDEVSGKTSRPITFKVNGRDLAEIQGGEVAVTNLHSCNGPDFVLQLHLSSSQARSSNQCQQEFLEANARLKCVYFPINKGKESIDNLIATLQEVGCGIGESFESFSRVSVRRLGRLLPETRWGLLPFMEPKQKVGEKAQMFKRCCARVKCFIDTDSGFDPTPYKHLIKYVLICSDSIQPNGKFSNLALFASKFQTDLAQNHRYTKVLKNFGNKIPENLKEVQIEISKDGNKLTLPQLERQYNDWILEMHNRYDDEVDGGLDEPTIVVVSSESKKLGISSDVVRVHKKIERRGKLWIAGQKLKVLKGACAGCHKSNVFATLEYIILEGLRGDTCGEARLICRPLGLPEGKGCQLSDGIDIRKSLSLPIRIIDDEKCIPIDDIEWNNKLDLKLPSSIDILSPINCKELGIEGRLPPNIVEAGDAPPENIVAVIRPKAFSAEKCLKKLDQKFIFRDTHDEMLLTVTHDADVENGGKNDHKYSSRKSSSSLKGLHGLYVFPIKSRCPNLFQTAGFYKFSFSLKGFKDLLFEQKVQVKASAQVIKWKVLSQGQNDLRVGCCFDPLSVACIDNYDNFVSFKSAPKLSIELISGSTVLARVCNMTVGMTSDKSAINIKGIVIETGELDVVRPNYEATLRITSIDKAFSVAVPCRVIPGHPRNITVHPLELQMQLIPGQIIEELMLEVFDEYGNHVQEGEPISLEVDGFCLQDGSGVTTMKGANCVKKVDDKGYVDLSSVLKVSKGYGQAVSLSVISNRKCILKLDFHTEKRELRAVQKVFENCKPGSHLENIEFEVIDSEGNIDESIHNEEKNGQSHTLSITSSSFDIDDSVRYSFRNGRCTIRSILLPHTEGSVTFSVAHSRYPELNSAIEVHVEKAWEENQDDNGIDYDYLLSTQSICENPVIPTQQSSLSATKIVPNNFSPQSSDGYVLPNICSSSLRTPKLERSAPRKENLEIVPFQVLPSQDIGSLDGSASIGPKELEDDFFKCGMARSAQLEKLQMLNFHRTVLQQSISNLQASINRDHPNVLSPCVKELTMKQIQRKSESAAAVICKILEEVPTESKPQDIIGVVALLGTVESIELSRMLAQYLGDDQMRAIVCTNYEAACYYLGKSALDELASKLGQVVTGGYLAFCLEDIRPGMREPNSNPEELLSLQTPISPDGNVVQGFLGYAVNLISIEASYLHLRTTSGHGLREALFYHLFGKLQVYRDRECMMMARSCIKDGAVSLDGGIIKGNGLVSFGHWEPDVIFPVRNIAATPQSLPKLKMLERTKLDLMELERQIDEESKSYELIENKFQMSRERYNRYKSTNGAE